MDVRVAVASHSLGSGFAGLMYSHIRKQLRPGCSIAECGVVMRKDREFLRSRLLRLLEAAPRPIALVGICLRPDPETLADYRAAGVPVVLIDEEAEGASTVASDNFAGGYLAAEHLLDKGRRSPALVIGELGTNGSYNAVERLRGFEKALADRGLPFSRDDVVEVVDYSRKDGVTALTELVRRRSRIDAVFCAAGDVCATGVLAEARERRMEVPSELAVLGYDDNPLASISHPPLSTLRQPLEEIAAQAWRLATESTAEILVRPKRVLLKPALVQRGST
ncbi:MAG TPA: substrate-binding domain-containing protein [Anaeromyxobacter sp.]|nr:substrate-binding domain-containing protein [Anaeromyxobacter sp.]